MHSDKEQLIYSCIEQIKKDLLLKDEESLIILLDYLSYGDLLSYLPEDKQKEFL